jgi:ribosomal protein L12E/L44/L45/RPP1/RPP2
LIKSAITPLVVIRNTRDALKKVGYKFPKRIIEPSQITMTAPAQSVYDAIESYILDYFGRTEEIIYGGENAIGFLYTTYFQRIVSSFNSAFHTLRKRRDKLQGWLDSDFRNIHPDEPDDEDDDESSGFVRKELSENDRIQAGIKCRQELMVLKPIIEGLASLSGDNSNLDPKLARLAEIIDGLLQGAQRGPHHLVELVEARDFLLQEHAQRVHALAVQRKGGRVRRLQVQRRRQALEDVVRELQHDLVARLFAAAAGAVQGEAGGQQKQKRKQEQEQKQKQKQEQTKTQHNTTANRGPACSRAG